MKLNSILLLILTTISSISIAIIGLMFSASAYASFYNPESISLIETVFKAAANDIFPWTTEEKVEDDKQEIPVVKKNKATKETKSYTVVDDSYFDDALFIGDSRMVGLSQYCQEIDSRATFYAKKSLTVFNIRDDKWIETEDGNEISLSEALENKQFSKIYIMVGINELGTGDEIRYRNAYEDVINEIRSKQPNAYIFVNSVMHVSQEKNDSDELYNNTNINIRNEAIKTLEDKQTIFYLDINEAVDDENGNMRQDMTSDGVHLKGACYEPWHQYLLNHGVL